VSRAVLWLCLSMLAAPARAQTPSELVPPRTFVDAGQWICAIDDREDVQCWLNVEKGEWPNPTLASSPRTFQKIPGMSHAVAIDGSYNYVCSLDRQGSVHCWGDLGGGAPRLWPRRIALSGPARQLVVRDGAGCALLGSGQVQCWGFDLCLPETRSGDLLVYSEDPVLLELQSEPIQLSASGVAWCALDRQGFVTCWGETCPHVPHRSCTPKRVAIDGVRAIASQCGIVGDDRQLHCWATNDGWQSSKSSAASRCAPTRMRNVQRVKQLSIGQSYGLALTDEGQVYYWGEGHVGDIQAIGRDVEAAQTISLAHVRSRDYGSSFEIIPEVSEPHAPVSRPHRFDLAPKRLPSLPGTRVTGVIASEHYSCLKLAEGGPYCEFVLGRVPFRLEQVWPSVRFDDGRRGMLEAQTERP
jgi:hypothetical protein